MASLNASLRSHLTGDTAIAALVDERVFPVGEDGSVSRYPYISFQRISSTHFRHLRGGSGVTRVRMQINCWARDSESSETLARAVRARLHCYRGSMGASPNELQVRGLSLSDEDDHPEKLGDDSQESRFRLRQDFVLTYFDTTPNS